jgi:GlpG protein
MRVIETSLDDNLAVMSAILWRRGIAHRVFEERGRQILEVHDPVHAEAARQLYGAWRDGRVRLVADAEPGPPRSGPVAAGVAALRGYPALSLLIVLALLVFPFSMVLAEGRMNPVAGALLIVDPARLAAGAAVGGSASLLTPFNPWRWLTPMLLHFSIMHLAFNCVVVIELGRRIENGLGTLSFTLLIGAIALISNLAQYLVGGSVLFGGLSGVGYGLLGVVLAMSRRRPADATWRLPNGLAIGLLVFLVLFTTGVTEWFGLHVANAAHWAGLIAGLLLALLWPLRSTPR